MKKDQKKMLEELDILRNKVKQLQEVHGYYHYIINNMEDVVWIMDAETAKFKYISPSVYRSRGYTVAEVMAQSMDEVFAPSSLEKIKNWMDERISLLFKGATGPNTYVDEVEQPCKDGSMVWTEVISRYILQRDGKIEIHGVSRDISTRKKQQGELSEKEHALEEMVSTKDRILSIVAHDLKGPLGNMMQLLNHVLMNYQRIEDQKKKVILQALETSAHASYDLLENLLTWARAQDKNIKLQPAKYNVLEWTDSILELYSHTILHKDLKVSREIDKELIALFDKGTISTVLRNILSNAIKFTPENGSIKIKAYKTDHHVEIQVNDSGIGIQPEDKESIFNLNKEKVSLGTAGERGSGIGLVLSKELVEKNMGEIGFYSKPEEGTTFWIRLPL